MRNIQELREYEDLKDTGNELKHGPQANEMDLEGSEYDEMDQIEIQQNQI